MTATTHRYEVVPTFEECINICKEWTGFSHSTQDMHGTTIHSFKYNFSIPNMWESKSDNGTTIIRPDGRINMRGITFDDNKNMIALPFPKFFNHGEVATTKGLDMNQATHIAEKMDGSLVSFFQINGILEVKTMKSALSDVAVHARNFLNSGRGTSTAVKEFATRLIVDMGLSPIFEYVSPFNPIVVDYDDREDFIFLGARSMETGKILQAHAMAVPAGVSVPKALAPSTASAYLDEENVEGVVVTMPDGMMFKMKSEGYVAMHRTCKGPLSPKLVVQEIISGTIDDRKGQLSLKAHTNSKMERIEKIEELYSDRYKELENIATDYLETNKDMSRKEIAVGMMKNKVFGEDTGFFLQLVMRLEGGKDIQQSINNRIEKESKQWIA